MSQLTGKLASQIPFSFALSHRVAEVENIDITDRFTGWIDLMTVLVKCESIKFPSTSHSFHISQAKYRAQACLPESKPSSGIGASRSLTSYNPEHPQTLTINYTTLPTKTGFISA